MSAVDIVAATLRGRVKAEFGCVDEVVKAHPDKKL